MSILNRAEMFNLRASTSKNKPNEIISRLRIKKGDTIADIGSGGGYFTTRFAAEVGLGGEVYALDIDKGLLQYIALQSKNNGFTNIRTVLIDKKVEGLPREGCDLVFLRNVYHHIHEPEEYFKEIKKFLKTNGKIAIIDYKKTNNFKFINLIRHFAKQEDIIRDLKKAGYRHIDSFDILQKQSFNIFQI